MSKYIKPSYLTNVNGVSSCLSLAYGGMDIYNSYIADGESLGYNTTKTTARTIFSFAGGLKGAAIGASYGSTFVPAGSIVG